METRVTDAELARDLADILSRVHDRGERFVVVRDGEPVATLAPSESPPGITVAELIARTGDLGMPGDGFADDLEWVQAHQPKAEFPEWPS